MCPEAAAAACAAGAAAGGSALGVRGDAEVGWFRDEEQNILIGYLVSYLMSTPLDFF